MTNELKQIKKKYGEHMMKLCRTYFPTILNEEGKLIEILDSTFGHPKYLYDDIIENNSISTFKNFIYYKYQKEKEKRNKSTKTPYQLMKEAGYTLYECKSNDDIMKFRKYYASNEELCTFRDKRLETNHVFFAVKDNVDDIKRNNFTNPERQDLYGTSVISIQFSRGDVNTLSIKNRYNHTVDNPDATFDNNLENIIPGLTDSFENYYGLDINQSEPAKLGLKYVKANDGKYYKYNMEINNIYYCPDNIIIKNSEVIKDFLDKEKYLVIDYFVLNLQNISVNRFTTKSLSIYDTNVIECFYKDLKNFDKININKNNDGTKTVELIKKGNKKIYIEIDKFNSIISYTNNNLVKLEDSFLKYNKKLTKINIENVVKIGDGFLCYNENLLSLKLPNVVKIANIFLCDCSSIKTLVLPKLKNVGDDFLGWNKCLEYLYAPNLKRIGENFLYANKSLKSLILPKTKEVGHNFLIENKKINYIEMPNIKIIGSNFMNKNKDLVSADFPKLEILRYGFLKNNNSLKKINLPNVISIEHSCLQHIEIEEFNLDKVKYIGEGFMKFNLHLKKISMPQLTYVGDYFLYNNEFLEKISFPKLETIGDCFVNNNSIINSVYLPTCTSIGNKFLCKNKKIRELSLPKVKTIGYAFLLENDELNSLSMNDVETIRSNFLYRNNCLKKISFPKLKSIEKYFLAMNEVLAELYVPNLDLDSTSCDFYEKYDKLVDLSKRKVL